MPDVENALKFQRKMVAVETAYLKQVQVYRAEARRQLLEIVQREGAGRFGVERMRAVVDDLTRRVSAEGAQRARDIRHHVQNYTRKNLELAKRAGLTSSADLAPVLAMGQEVARDGEESYMTSTSAWLEQLQISLQAQAARLRISDAGPEEITARLLNERMADGRASVWMANGNQAKNEETSNVWVYGVGLLGAYLAFFNQSQPAVEFKKQAIATIDDRTTDCCLRAHGQIQDIDDPFELTGTPRYADEVQDPPFHWYCRTSEALYNEAFERFGVTTEKMRDMARLEMDARELTGKRVRIFPSHSTSRRAGQLPSG